MLTVATVYKTGGQYTADHVYRLREQVRRVSPDAAFVPLTDADLVIPSITLTDGWPGWWSKIELFRPGLWSGHVVYLDLDTDVIGPLEALKRDRFTMLSDFYRPQQPASGVMAWKGAGPQAVYDAFRKSPARFMSAYTTTARWGDQGFIRDHAGEIHRFGDEVCSYKVHCKNGVPKTANVVAYHGNPKPWDLTDEQRRALTI